jgi:hypothetical protein
MISCRWVRLAAGKGAESSAGAVSCVVIVQQRWGSMKLISSKQREANTRAVKT